MTFTAISHALTYAVDAAMIAAVLYIPAAFAAHCCRTHKAATATESAPVQKEATVDVAITGFIGDVQEFEPAPAIAKPAQKTTLTDVIRQEVKRPKSGTVAKVDHTYDIPDSIRGLRDYIRTNGLQEAVRDALGKTVSKATKAELIATLGAI